MECYICHRLVERHEYTRHVGSHSPYSVMGIMDPASPTFKYDTFEHRNTAFPVHSTPPHLRTRTSQAHAHPQRAAAPNGPVQSSGVEDYLSRPIPVDNHREETPGEQSAQLDEFQKWHKNYARDYSMYTTIDGEKSDVDLDADIQAAQVLRRTTRDEVIKIVNEFKGFPSSDDQKRCLELVRKAPIFPGLVAYTYTHLIMCPRRPWLGWGPNDDWSDQIYELKKMVECWTKYDDMWCILSCDKVKEGLLKILRATTIGLEEHKCNSALLDGTLVLSYDTLNLAALVVPCITGLGKEHISNLLDRPEELAQVHKLIELFHDLLESHVPLEGCYRRRILSALVNLSMKSGSCPRGMDIPEAAINSKSLKSMGAGGFGCVYKGELGSRLVAVKALKRDSRLSLSDYSKKVSKEAIVWRYLRHRNCLPLYGVYTMPMEATNITIALVSPWMDQGTLSDYLERNPTANRTKLILDVVRGLNYLHTLEPHVAHRDIKPENILITRRGHACLADFGLASVFDMDDHLHTVASKVLMGGTDNYMAPEILNTLAIEDKVMRSDAIRHVNKRLCDMYALGSTIYAAYAGRPLSGELQAEVMFDKRPVMHNNIPPDMKSFIKNLCAYTAKERLTAEKALDWMEFKASHEGVVDSGPGLLDEPEWEWKSQVDEKSLWSVPF